jgi:nucleoside-diphosphate-sugar epimerase
MLRSLKGLPYVVLGCSFIGHGLIRALLSEGAVVRGFGRSSQFGPPNPRCGPSRTKAIMVNFAQIPLVYRPLLGLVA